MEDIDKKIWDMLNLLDEVEPSVDFEQKLFKRIEEIEAKKSTFIEKIKRLIFIPVPAAAIIGLLLGIILGNITIKSDMINVSVKEPAIILNLDSFSDFYSNGLTHSYISMLKEGGKNK